MKRLITFTSATMLALAGGLLAQGNAKLQRDPVDLKKAALQIDHHIASFYRNKKLPVPAVTDDATFLRRAFLVAIDSPPDHTCGRELRVELRLRKVEPYANQVNSIHFNIVTFINLHTWAENCSC
ncbi:MAG: hypothetical protein ACRCXD_17905 [Luteolibacter sp.]